jgi:hypothetical protein
MLNVLKSIGKYFGMAATSYNLNVSDMISIAGLVQKKQAFRQWKTYFYDIYNICIDRGKIIIQAFLP